MKLRAYQIDRAVATLEYFSTRTKEAKSGEDNKVVLVQNPCTFSGPVTWDLAANEAAMRDALAAHGKARRNLLQKHVANGMAPDKPTPTFLQESNDLDDTQYEIDIILIPVDELKAEDNKIPNSYRAAIRFMVDFGNAKSKSRPQPVAEVA